MKRLALIFLVALIACVLENPKVTILNKSGESYDSIKVYTNQNIQTTFKHIKPKETLNGRIRFDKTITSDGAYVLQIFRNGKVIRNECFGYYTNGRSLNRRISVIIEQDTLIFSLK